jgi:hypothetical protein
MLNKFAAALIAASMLSAPLLVGGDAAMAAAPKAAMTAKPATATVKHHRKHVRPVRHTRAKHAKGIRSGKVTALNANAKARYHVKHVKKHVRQGRKSNKAPST